MVRAVLLVALTAGAVGVVLALRDLPKAQAQEGGKPPVPAWPAAPVFAAGEWTAIRSARPASGPFTGTSTNNARYRLAGTFIAPPGAIGAATGAICKAILDDLRTQQQFLLAEGETAGALKLLRIRSDRVIVEIEGRTEELYLAFGIGVAPSSGAAANASSLVDVPAEKVLDESSYGKRVGETRWVMNREALLGYYREMLDNPERIAKLYDTFKPDYAEGKVAGYRVKVEGEPEFLKSVGLKEGDVVRMVNSMRMTSQSRAEFWLGEFAKDRMGAAVLDIEREGRPQKLVYLFR